MDGMGTHALVNIDVFLIMYLVFRPVDVHTDRTARVPKIRNKFDVQL